MNAVIGKHDSKFSCPTLVDTETDICHDLFRSAEDAQESPNLYLSVIRR